MIKKKVKEIEIAEEQIETYVTISKTWQEDQYEPFKVTLSMKTTSDTPYLEMQNVAETLQKAIDRIYEKRRRSCHQ